MPCSRVAQSDATSAVLLMLAKHFDVQQFCLMMPATLSALLLLPSGNILTDGHHVQNRTKGYTRVGDSPVSLFAWNKVIKGLFLKKTKITDESPSQMLNCLT